MIYAYIRVSTEKQSVQNQKFEIENFSKTKGLKIQKFIQETASGMIMADNRKLGILLKSLKKGDILIVSELSRLGRSLLEVMSLLNTCIEKNIIIYSVKEHYELGDNINSKILAFAFSLSAEIERKMISERTKEALARKRAEGVILGRPLGRQSSIQSNPCHKAKEKILAWNTKGLSHTKIAQKIGVHRDTLRRWFIKSGNEHLLKKKISKTSLEAKAQS